MKIAFVCPIKEQCGIVDYADFFAQALKNNHANVEVLPFNKLSTIAAYKKLIIAANTADVVHLQYDWSFFGKNFLQRLIRSFVFVSGITVPKVATVHEFLLFKQRGLMNRFRSIVANMIQRRFFSFFDTLIVHTEEGKEYLLSLGIKAEKVFLMTHPIPEVYRNGSLAPFESNGRKILTVFGFLTARKGVHTILPALSNLPDCLLVIAGGKHPKDKTSYFEYLRDRIHTLGLNNQVKITGYLSQEDIKQILMATDIVVAPFLESFGSGSISFAAAYQKPVIASDINYFKELQKNGFGIELFRASDALDFEEKVKSLLSSEKTKHRLTKLMEVCADKYSYVNAAARILCLYNDIVKARKK